MALGFCLGERGCPRRWADGINRNCGGHDGLDLTLTERMQATGIDMTSTPGRHEAPGPGTDKLVTERAS